MTLLESFTAIDWLIVAIGCALVILTPSLVIAWTVTLPPLVFRFVTRRDGRPEPSRPAGNGVDPESEWSDIERELDR